MDSQDKGTILLVDDEMIIGMATKLNLEKFGYTVVHVMSGGKALETVREQADIDLILMDIDLGDKPNGIETCTQIQTVRDIPVVFVSSHTELDIISLTESVTSYGYIVKSSHMTVYDASIKMAYKLFSEKRDRLNYSKYLEIALANASEPIFITDNHGDIVFFNKAYLAIQGLTDPALIEKKFAEYQKLIIVFSDEGVLLQPYDWASTRGISGQSDENIVFYVYHKGIQKLLANKYTYAPVYNEAEKIIGAYVKIDPKAIEVDKKIVDKIISENSLIVAKD